MCVVYHPGPRSLLFITNKSKPDLLSYLFSCPLYCIFIHRFLFTFLFLEPAFSTQTFNTKHPAAL